MSVCLSVSLCLPLCLCVCVSVSSGFFSCFLRDTYVPENRGAKAHGTVAAEARGRVAEAHLCGSSHRSDDTTAEAPRKLRGSLHDDLKVQALPIESVLLKNRRLSSCCKPNRHLRSTTSFMLLFRRKQPPKSHATSIKCIPGILRVAIEPLQVSAVFRVSSSSFALDRRVFE